MKSITLNIDEKYFNLLWRSFAAREELLESRLNELNDESVEVAQLSNDLVYLRLCQKELKETAEKSNFTDGAFSLDEGIIDLAEM